MQRSKLPFPWPLTQDEILKKRASILAQLLCMDDGFCSIPSGLPSSQTLRHMLSLYDRLFFSGSLLKKLPDLHVTLSSRLTSSAGKFIYVRGVFGRISQPEIRMSSDFLTRLCKGPFCLNGLTVATAQEAFLVVFEHELCHAVEAALYKSTGHSDRFLTLANGLFGHTATRHRLPTRKQEAAKGGLYVGSRVSFCCSGSELQGFVSYIGKSVTVMVPSPSGHYQDSNGQKYEKYRVSLEKLTVLS